MDVQNGKWTINWIFFFKESEVTDCCYGDGEIQVIFFSSDENCLDLLKIYIVRIICMYYANDVFIALIIL